MPPRTSRWVIPLVRRSTRGGRRGESGSRGNPLGAASARDASVPQRPRGCFSPTPTPRRSGTKGVGLGLMRAIAIPARNGTPAGAPRGMGSAWPSSAGMACPGACRAQPDPEAVRGDDHPRGGTGSDFGGLEAILAAVGRGRCRSRRPIQFAEARPTLRPDPVHGAEGTPGTPPVSFFPRPNPAKSGHFGPGAALAGVVPAAPNCPVSPFGRFLAPDGPLAPRPDRRAHGGTR
jgi:hypothetical protein